MTLSTEDISMYIVIAATGQSWFLVRGRIIMGGGVRPAFWFLYRNPGRTEIMMEPFFRRERPSREKVANSAPR